MPIETENFLDKPVNNIFAINCLSVQLWFPTSKTGVIILYNRLSLRVAERLKAYNLRKISQRKL